MILLSILVTPVGIAMLFVVMSWTERALDHKALPQAGAVPVTVGQPD